MTCGATSSAFRAFANNFSIPQANLWKIGFETQIQIADGDNRKVPISTDAQRETGSNSKIFG
jgi:hypothetical protein